MGTAATGDTVLAATFHGVAINNQMSELINLSSRYFVFKEMVAFCTFLHQCSHCGKIFLTAGYFEAHHLRCHSGITFAQLPNTSHNETEHLRSEIKELKERLNNTDRLLHKESVKAIKVNKTSNFAKRSSILYDICMKPNMYIQKSKF